MRMVILITVFALSVFLIFLYKQTAKAEYAPTINASIKSPVYYYIIVSEKLSEGIFFTNETGALQNIQYPLLSGSSGNNAVWNYNQSSQTEYYIYAGGDINVDICSGATNHLCSTPGCSGVGNVLINISNAVWSSSFTNDQNNPSPAGSVSFVIGYDNNNKVARSIQEKNVHLRFWLSLPSNTPSLTYNTTYQIKAVPQGGSCA